MNPITGYGKAGISRVSSYVSGVSQKGWTRKTTVIKRYKSGTEKITEKGHTFTIGDVALGAAGCGVAACGIIAAWGAYCFLRGGHTPAEDFMDWLKESIAGGDKSVSDAIEEGGLWGGLQARALRKRGAWPPESENP